MRLEGRLSVLEVNVEKIRELLEGAVGIRGSMISASANLSTTSSVRRSSHASGE